MSAPLYTEVPYAGGPFCTTEEDCTAACIDYPVSALRKAQLPTALLKSFPSNSFCGEHE